MDWFAFDSPGLCAVLIVTVVAFILGGLVKGAVGLGMPVTVVGVMSLITDVRTAAILVIAPVIVTNLWQCWASGRTLRVYKRYWRLTCSMSIILLLTASASADISLKLVTLSAGFVVVLFAIANLFLQPLSIPSRMDGCAQYAAGIATGVLGGMSGLVVVPLAIYFTASRLDKEMFVASTAPFFLLGAVLLCVGYSYGGALDITLILLSLSLVVPALAGLLIGEWIRVYISEDSFRVLLLSVFFCTGVHLVQRGLVG